MEPDQPAPIAIDPPSVPHPTIAAASPRESELAAMAEAVLAASAMTGSETETETETEALTPSTAEELPPTPAPVDPEPEREPESVPHPSQEQEVQPEPEPAATEPMDTGLLGDEAPADRKVGRMRIDSLPQALRAPGHTDSTHTTLLPNHPP